MKKGSYWFSKLSEQEQKEFKENAERGWETGAFESFLERTKPSFNLFVKSGFLWG